MKIVLVQLIGRGGTQLYISQLANSLANTNNEVTVLLGRYLYDENHYQDSKSKVVLIDSEPSFFKMGLRLFNPLTYYNILKIIHDEKPDVVHMVFEDLISGIVFCFLSLSDKKLILTEHNPTPHLGDTGLSRFNQQFTKFLVRNIVGRIIVHGDNIKLALTNKGIPDDKICVIPHGDYSFYDRWSKQLDEEKNSILFFGLIREYKGLEYLINAAPIIISSIPDAKIVIAGSGDFSKYAPLIKDENNFEIHNKFILDEEVADFFERASVVVLPYIEGSQSGIVPIACAFKKPVIVTNVGSIAEVVDDNETGFVIPPRDHEALASSIIKLLKNDSLRKNMGEKGYKKMIDNSSWTKVADKIVEVYDEIL